MFGHQCADLFCPDILSDLSEPLFAYSPYLHQVFGTSKCSVYIPKFDDAFCGPAANVRQRFELIYTCGIDVDRVLRFYVDARLFINEPPGT